MEGKHANRYTTVLMHVDIAEKKNIIQLLPYTTKQEELNIENIKDMLIRQVWTIIMNFNENLKVWLRIEIYEEIEFFK